MQQIGLSIDIIFSTSKNATESKFPNCCLLILPDDQNFYFRRREVLSDLSVLLTEKNEFENCQKMHFGNAKMKSAADYLGIVEKCVQVKSGISKQYLYRSMYAPQISRCARYIPLKHMLFIFNEDMKKNITSVVEKV